MHEATWEAEDMLTNCGELLEEFLLRKHPQQQQVTKSPIQKKVKLVDDPLIVPGKLPAPAGTQVSTRGRSVRAKVPWSPQ